MLSVDSYNWIKPVRAGNSNAGKKTDVYILDARSAVTFVSCNLNTTSGEFIYL